MRDSLYRGLVVGGRNGSARGSRGFWGRAAAQKGQQLLDRLVLRRTVTVKRLGGGEADEKAFWRFLHNERVSERALIGAARTHLLAQVAGRRVLAIQDTSEINFSRQKHRKAAFGRGGNGTDPALFIHPVLAVDADTGVVLGLADVQLWAHHEPAPSAGPARKTADKLSQRWLDGAQAAAGLRAAGATSVTVIADREGDIYAAFASRPPEVELLVRAQTDRGLADDGYLFAHLDNLPIAQHFTLDLPAIPGRAARRATMALRYAPVSLRRPRHSADHHLPPSLTLHALDVREIDPPAGVEGVHWRLLSSAPIESLAQAHQAIADYRCRWQVEQLFRTLKSQGLGLEDSQIEKPGPLYKLALIALRAAVVCMQLVQARDGADNRPATAAFAGDDIKVLEVIAPPLTAGQPGCETPSSPNPCHGPPGSSPASDPGAAPTTPSHPDPLQCIGACNASTTSLMA
jgi:hypothetical protein